MFCTNCGKEIADDVVFCPACGTKRGEIPDISNVHNPNGILIRKDPHVQLKIEKYYSKKKEISRNIIFKIWNSPLFTKMAIKFGNILEILEGIIFFILSGALFGEGDFWGVIFGIIFLLGGLGGCISGVVSLLHRKKNNEKPYKI